MTAEHRVPLPDPDDVRQAAAVCDETLRAFVDRDWETTAGDLEWSARTTAAHIVRSLLFYARDLATPVLELTDEELVLAPAPDSSIGALTDGVRETAAVVAAVVAGTPDDVRAYHPFGMADRSGFAAMACDELLIHTDDIARGFGEQLSPPEELCERVLARLFPWAPGDGPAWTRLRWANGRTALPDRPRLAPRWRWHAAPLDEWDGTTPAFVSTSDVGTPG